ncbi:MAG: metallophosphoesterase [Isosphaeraceae bacterium]
MTPPTVWGISDLHLSGARPERRDRLAGRWRDHPERLAAAWKGAVAPEDLVLIPGDISMARNHREVQPDLAWLERLPGRKVLAPGNHDVWWNGVDRIRPMLRRSMVAVDGDAIRIGEVVACGARGVPVPEEGAPPEQLAAAERELERIERALSLAAGVGGPGIPIFVLWHYPPVDSRGRPGPWMERWEAAGVAHVVYGHIHAERQWGNALRGMVRGVRYSCVAADSIGFRPLRLSPGPTA